MTVRLLDRQECALEQARARVWTLAVVVVGAQRGAADTMRHRTSLELLLDAIEHFLCSLAVGFWEQLQKKEYGFWANVNPQVPHPRWSQASERVLGTSERIPTILFNGYGEFVADLYKDLEGERLYM